MIDHSKMKLGRHIPRHDHRTLQFAKYVQASLPTPPASVDYTEAIREWGMMGNDKIGDCTCAAAGHLVMAWTKSTGTIRQMTDAEIEEAYSAITGYKPNDPRTDRGAVELDVLKFWQKKGIGKSADKLGAFVALEPKNLDHIRDAVALFVGCYIGLALPMSAQTQSVWAVPPGGAEGAGAPGSWGGHAVSIVGYDSRGLTVVTWGALKRMTWQFWSTYCDEAYALLSQDYFNGKKKSPMGFDMAALQADLIEVQG